MADLSKLINMERVQMINPTPIYNKFKYVSAECGSGKTTALCNMINNTLNTKGSTEKIYYCTKHTETRYRYIPKNHPLQITN